MTEKCFVWYYNAKLWDVLIWHEHAYHIIPSERLGKDFQNFTTSHVLHLYTRQYHGMARAIKFSWHPKTLDETIFFHVSDTYCWRRPFSLRIPPQVKSGGIKKGQSDQAFSRRPRSTIDLILHQPWLSPSKGLSKSFLTHCNLVRTWL